MGMAELVRTQMDTGLLGVVLKHFFAGRAGESRSDGSCSLRVPRLLFENDPEVISTRVGRNPDFREVEIEESQKRRWQMHKTISAIASFCPGSILILRSKSDKHTM